jgi:predicted kinase
LTNQKNKLGLYHANTIYFNRSSRMKTVILLRACSNAGKSTFAEYLQSFTGYAVICCADDYFYQDGEYKFNPQGLGAAHGECRRKFVESVESGKELIIVANTNTSPKEFQFYIDNAEDCGYRVFSIILEKRHEKLNDHNCPDTSIMKQSENIKQSLKLF